MATTGLPGTPNMRHAPAPVNPDRKGRISFPRATAVTAAKPVPLSPDELIEAQLCEIGGLTPNGARAARLLAEALTQAHGRGRTRRTWRVDELLNLGRCGKSAAYTYVRTMLDRGLIREVRPYFPGDETSPAQPALYVLDESFFSITRFRDADHQEVTEYPSVQQRNKVPAPPQEKYRRPASGGPREEKPKVTPEIVTLAHAIDELPGGGEETNHAALASILHREGLGVEAASEVLSDVALVMSQRDSQDAARGLARKALAFPAIREEFAAKAAKIRASLAAPASQPAADSATRIAAEFGITTPTFATKILPEALAEPATAVAMVKLGLAQNAMSANPIRVPAIYALRALTMPEKWAEIRDCPEAQKLLAGRSEALRKVIRAGWIRCAAHDVPAAILPHLEAWAALQVTMPPPDAAGHWEAHQAERQTHAMLLAAAVEALGSRAAILSEVLRQRLAASGMTEGSVVWPRAWRAAWAKVVAEEVPWMPLEILNTERVAA